MKPTFKDLLDSEDYNSLKGINIIYTGLLVFNNYNNHEGFWNSIYKGLDIDNEQLGFQKRKGANNLWYVRCQADSKLQAYKEIMNYLTELFKNKSVKNISLSLQVSLAHFSHKEPGRFLSDPIDYNYIDHLEVQTSSLFKDSLEPVEPYFGVWDGKSWSVSP
ncbi:hypothetical protein [Psychrobacter urativorans]|uniref:Uncharacterized protein n=1 Tax=Psychrobacter urativorans TaxID=45610 RepID=A0A0M4TDP9_9GAMM|nr:hypothetical protein [Psychrobacter urativorans]ALF60308.1 hypothetical protein AOC03_09885 [Psychrobacter urativorans]